ncbi:uncharacterized protein LOC143264446 [Megachile rotundata]|uniref:uncharacterized protein LOC143264446 n=1 Tax=Megachile rotundata TaxID=143995 RepID=UPI000258E2BB
MFAVQRVVRHTPRLLKLSENQCRTLMCTPPRVRISFAEKMVHGIVLYVGMMAIPIYVSCNVNNYNKKG